MMASKVMANHYKFETLNGKKWWYCKFNTKVCPMVAINETDIRQHVLDSHYINGLPPIDNNGGHQLSSAATGSDTNGTDTDFIDDEDYYDSDVDEDWKQPSDDSNDSLADDSVSTAVNTYDQLMTSDGSDDDNEDNNTGSDTQDTSQGLALNQDLIVDNDSHQYSEDNTTVSTIESQPSGNRKTVRKSPRKTTPKSDGQRRRPATVGKYKCREPGCPKAYRTKPRLKKHECGHKCGFSVVPGDELDGLCGNANLNKYMDEVVVKNGGQQYMCLYDDCQYETNILSTLREHVHWTHVCPKYNGVPGTATPRPRTGRPPIYTPKPRKTGTTTTAIKTSGNSSHSLLNTAVRNVISDATTSGQQHPSTISNGTPPDVKYRPLSNRKSGSNIVINDRISLQTPSDAKVSFKISYKTGGQPVANTTTTTTVTTTSRPQPSASKSPKTPIKLKQSPKTRRSPARLSMANTSPISHAMLKPFDELLRQQWVTIRHTSGQKLFKCRYDPQRCGYKIAGKSREMTKHVNFVHLNARKYGCTESGCKSTYASNQRLIQHLRNHLCGYSIKTGDKVAIECRSDNLMTYRQTVRKGSQTLLKCMVCLKVFSSLSSIKDHIHGQHVCPHRNVGRIRGSGGQPLDGGSRASPTNSITNQMDCPSTSGTSGTRSTIPAAKRFKQTTSSSIQALRLRHAQQVAKVDNRSRSYRSSVSQAIRTSKAPQIQYKSSGKAFIIQKINDKNIDRHLKEDHRSDPNYRGLCSIRQLKKEYYKLDVIDGCKWYRCRWRLSHGLCEYKTPSTRLIARHVNCVHLKNRQFPCTQDGCQSVYNNPNSLQIHLRNHLCGFRLGIGKTLDTVCGNRSINRFRQRVVGPDSKKYFQCSFPTPNAGPDVNPNGCKFHTTCYGSIQEHIHYQHMCPNRVKVIECPNETIIGRQVTVDEMLNDGSGAGPSTSGQLPQTPTTSRATNGQHLASDSIQRLINIQKMKNNAKPKHNLKDTDSDVTDDDMDWEVNKHRSKRRRISSAATKRPNIADTDQQSDLKCTHEGCGRQFTTKNKLDQHMADHRCGYGIDPDITNVCNHTNLKQYEQPYSDDRTGDRKFRCGYDLQNCIYWAFSAGSLRDHIHRTHVCPNRVLKYKRSYIKTESVIDNEWPFNDLIDKVVKNDDKRSSAVATVNTEQQLTPIASDQWSATDASDSQSSMTASNSQPSLAVSDVQNSSDGGQQRPSTMTVNNELPIADDNDSQSMTVSTNGQTLTKTSIDSHSSDVDSDDEDSTSGSFGSSSDEDYDDWISGEVNPDLEVIDSPSEADEPEDDIQDIASNGSQVDDLPSNPSVQELDENFLDWMYVRDQSVQTSAVMAANCRPIGYLYDCDIDDDDDLGGPQASYQCQENGCNKWFMTANALSVHQEKHQDKTTDGATTSTATTNETVRQLIHQRDPLRLGYLSSDVLQMRTKELDRLLIMRPHFRVDLSDGVYGYQCQLCPFRTSSMVNVYTHLKCRHFIPNLN